MYRYGTRPDVEVLDYYYLLNSYRPLALLTALNVEIQDGHFFDGGLESLHRNLSKALRLKDEEELETIIYQIKNRFENLGRVYSKPVYSSPPAWFTWSR